MRANAINALLSGPAAGVVGAVRQAGRSGYRNLVTLDIGGTSTDVCVVSRRRAAADAGVPARRPADPHSPARYQYDRRRRRHRSSGSTKAACCASARARPAPSRGRPATAAAGPSRPSPTRTSCAARFAPRRSSADACRSMPRRQRAPCSPSPSASAWHSRLRPTAPWRSRMPTSCVPSSSSRPSAATIRATTCSCPMAAPGRCMPPTWPRSSASRPSWCRPSAGIISAYGLIASDFVLFESMTRRAVGRRAGRRCAARGIPCDARAGRSAARRGERYRGPARLRPSPPRCASSARPSRCRCCSRNPSSRLSTQQACARGSARRTSASTSSAEKRPSRSSSCPSGSASSRRSRRCRCCAKRNRWQRRRGRSASSTAKPGTTRTCCTAAHSHGRSAHRVRR